MENKFYTPTIEEFGIGFEYEHFKTIYNYKLSARKISETLWTKQCYNTSISLSTITKEIKSGNIKVKYLDSTDIESLGFEIKDLIYYDSNDTGNFVNKETLKEIYTKHIKSHMGGNYGLNDEYLCIRTNHYRPQYFELIKVQYYGDGSASLRTKFQGNIKNKSELKKLLKMLEI